MESLKALCVLFSAVRGPSLFPLFFFPSLTHFPNTHTHTHAHELDLCHRCEARSEPSAGSFMTTVGGICWSHLQWVSLTPPPHHHPPPFVTLGKSAKSKRGVSPVCVFNVPPVLSPMTTGGPPRVLALSPDVLSLLYLSTGHGRSPKDNHTCMLKEGRFYSSQHPQRKSDVWDCSPTAVVLFIATFEKPPCHPRRLNVCLRQQSRAVIYYCAIGSSPCN